MTADGEWKITTTTPKGDYDWVLSIKESGDTFTGILDMVESQVPLEEGKIDGNQLAWKSTLQKPRVLKFSGRATVDGDRISGEIRMGMFGTRPFSEPFQSGYRSGDLGGTRNARGSRAVEGGVRSLNSPAQEPHWFPNPESRAVWQDE